MYYNVIEVKQLWADLSTEMAHAAECAILRMVRALVDSISIHKDDIM